jgi:integrase
VRLIYPTLGNIPIQKFDMNKSTSAVDLVHQTLKPMWVKMPPTADEVRNNIECVLSWAIAKRYITGDNAASMKGPLGVLLQKISRFHEVEHYAALPHQQIGAFMAALRAVVNRKGRHRSPPSMRPASIKWRQTYVSKTKLRPRPVTTYVLDFLILTAVRKGQVLNMRWRDVDWENKVWVCTEHKTRKKVHQDYLVPLSDQALAILKIMRQQQTEDGLETEYVFTAEGRKRPVNHASLNMLLIRGVGGQVWKDPAGKDITLHFDPRSANGRSNTDTRSATARWRSGIWSAVRCAPSTSAMPPASSRAGW